MRNYASSIMLQALGVWIVTPSARQAKRASAPIPVHLLALFISNEQWYFLNRLEAMMNRELDIVQKAIDAAPHCPGLSLGRFQPEGGRKPPKSDGLLTIKHRDQSRTFTVEVKTHLHHALIERLLADAAKIHPGSSLLVVTDQIANKHSEMLMKAGVAFLDTAGNAFLNLPGLYLAVTGRRAPVSVRKPNPGRAFQASGLKLLFAFLTDPFLDADPSKALINQQFRSINQQTGVSLGSIGWILGDLQDAGYVAEDGKARLLIDRKNLLQKWVDNYTDRLRPKQQCRRYAAPSPDWWKDINLDVPHQLWGGEVAAAKLTGFIKPQIAAVYTRSQVNDLILDAGLRLDADGDVEVIDPFWGDWAHAAHEDCTHPLLVYADLLASDIDRNIETARRVYGQYLRHIIESD